MDPNDYSGIAFDERAHDADPDDQARYLVMREDDALVAEVHNEGDIESGSQLIDRTQLFDYLDEFLDRGGRVRLEWRS